MTSEMKKVPLYLAPMAGITDKIFRKLCFEQGCDAATTEMISGQGYMQAPKDLNVYKYLLDIMPGEKLLYAQIFGRDPIYLSQAAARLTDLGLFAGIDINMGCPAPKVSGSGAGSALMKTPELAGKIISEVVKSTCLPVSVKMRLGWDEEHINAVEMAKIAENEGAKCLTVHGRTRTQQYSGKANWEEIARVKEAVSIPVIANGDVTDAASAGEILSVTNCDGIAIARGALGNPWLFKEIKAMMNKEEYIPPSYQEVVDTAMRHARTIEEWKGERSAVMEMRKHFAWYLNKRRGARKLRTKINLMTSLDEVEALLRSQDE